MTTPTFSSFCVGNERQVSRGVEQTESLGRRIAEAARPGDCVALIGDLGAGKTQLVRGLVGGLGGSTRQVCSPTFVLLNIYDTPRMRVFHLDAYRVAGPDDFEAIGFGELLGQGGLTVVEWADRVEPLLPSPRLEVRLEVLGENERQIELAMR